MNKNIIIAILVVIIIGVAAFAMFSQGNSKTNTELTMLSGNTLNNGDQIQFELKDDKGNAIEGQHVNMEFTDSNGNIETFVVVTDANGKGGLALDNEDAGSHKFKATYAGNDKYDGSTLEATITINDGDSSDTVEEVYDSSTANSDNPTDSNSTDSNSTDSNSTDDNLKYDSNYGLYYDSYGIVHGGQCDGMSIYDIRERGSDPFEGIE